MQARLRKHAFAGLTHDNHVERRFDGSLQCIKCSRLWLACSVKVCYMTETLTQRIVTCRSDL
jgi:hypothetical protein